MEIQEQQTKETIEKDIFLIRHKKIILILYFSILFFTLEKNIKKLLEFYDSKNIPIITSNFYYEFGKKNFIQLLENPSLFDIVIKLEEEFDKVLNLNNSIIKQLNS